MLTKFLFLWLWCTNSPNGTHLKTRFFDKVSVPMAVFHLVVVESVFCFFFFSCPDYCFMRGSEKTAAKIRRRVRLEPCDVIEDVIPEGLQRVATLVNRMIRATNPQCAIGF